MPNLPTNQDQLSKEAKMELLRRRANLGASSSGIGAGVTNSPSPQNPIPTEMQTNPTTPSGGGGSPSISGGASGTPSDGTIAGIKSQKGEAQKLTEAMIWRQKKLTERGE